MLERFAKWADEIDQEWASYSTSYDKEVFIVYDHLKNEVARIDYNNGRYDISGDDLPAVKKLTDLTQHRH
ncbi:hypothetical protein [Olivibacter domesticus]|uniref:Uncharacterized protein n=1 Tax=Olivibacter domesticus TaxID=407022 RepID=A0A1H7U5L8_OLID1|nr:hypothetical protein [Olivibacter domesticus]SEL92059.1 hypothetical protein SAMN05661044_03737 [Olivibacter domesticus]